MRGRVAPVEKTWREWNDERIDGIVILDPDGFERHDPYESKYVYTRDEFLRRRNFCTVNFTARTKEGA